MYSYSIQNTDRIPRHPPWRGCYRGQTMASTVSGREHSRWDRKPQTCRYHRWWPGKEVKLYDVSFKSFIGRWYLWETSVGQHINTIFDLELFLEFLLFLVFYFHAKRLPQIDFETIHVSVTLVLYSLEIVSLKPGILDLYLSVIPRLCQFLIHWHKILSQGNQSHFRNHKISYPKDNQFCLWQPRGILSNPKIKLRYRLKHTGFSTRLLYLSAKSSQAGATLTQYLLHVV